MDRFLEVLSLTTNFQQVSVDAVAERAGMGRTTVFQQFESKSGLLLQLASSFIGLGEQ